MKILYVVHQFFPKWYTGTEKFVFMLATMMQKRGHSVTVITFATKEEQATPIRQHSILTERFIYKGLPVVSFSYEKSPIDLHLSVRNDNLKKFAQFLINEEKPDILHVAHPMRTGEFIFAAIEKNIPYIMTLTDFWLICPKYILVNNNQILCNGPKMGNQCKMQCKDIPFDLIENRLVLSKKLINNASCVCGLTNSLLDVFKDEIPEINAHIIELGLITAKTSDNHRVNKPGDNLRLMFGASLVPHKGLHILLHALKKISSDNLTLDVYGSGPDGPYMTEILKLMNNDNRVFYKGIFSEDQLFNIFKNVDLLVIPSLWWENSPYMMKEAMARNVPIIASDVGGLTVNIRNSHNGFTFKMGDIDALKNIIEMTLNKPILLNEIRENLSKEVGNTVEQEAYLYEKIYRYVT
jgi:glycosyltransferase involved in cell wall biosynthesis